MGVQGMAVAVAQQMDLGREPPAGTPQGVIRGLLGVVAVPAPGGTTGGADHGAVDAPQLMVDQTRIDAGGPQSREDRVQSPVVAPGVEEVPDGGPRAEFLGQVAPGRARPEDPEDAVEDLAPIPPGAARASGRGEEVFNELPLLIGKSVPQHPETASTVCMSVHTILENRSILRSQWRFSDRA